MLVARGVKLGTPANLRNRELGAKNSAILRRDKAISRAQDLKATFAEIRSAGVRSLRDIAVALNERKIPAPRGGVWQTVQVSRVIQQLARF